MINNLENEYQTLLKLQRKLSKNTDLEFSLKKKISEVTDHTNYERTKMQDIHK